MNHFKRSYTGHSDASHVDNFSVKSRKSGNPMREEVQQKVRKREKTQSGGKGKRHMINGVDFYGDEVNLGRRGQLLVDAYSVKGDYFYLKKGEMVSVRAAIGEYVEVRYESRLGYFPARVIKLIEGEAWREKGKKIRLGWQV